MRIIPQQHHSSSPSLALQTLFLHDFLCLCEARTFLSSITHPYPLADKEAESLNPNGTLSHHHHHHHHPNPTRQPRLISAHMQSRAPQQEPPHSVRIPSRPPHPLVPINPINLPSILSSTRIQYNRSDQRVNLQEPNLNIKMKTCEDRFNAQTSSD